MSKPDPIANCSEFEGGGLFKQALTLWKVCVGTGGCVYVWGTSDLGTVEEIAIDFADDKKWCGWFTFLEESDFRDAAKSLNLPWKSDWPDWSDTVFERVAQEAEADLSTIGHTTLDCQPKGAWGAYTNWEWNFLEVIDEDEITEVARRSMQECHGHDFLINDLVYYGGHIDEDDPDDTVPGGVYRIEHISNGDLMDVEGNIAGKPYHAREVHYRHLKHHKGSIPAQKLAQKPAQKPVQQKTEKERQSDFFFKPKPLPKDYKGGGFFGLGRGGSLFDLKSWRRR